MDAILLLFPVVIRVPASARVGGCERDDPSPKFGANTEVRWSPSV